MQSLSFILAAGLALAAASTRAQDAGTPSVTAPEQARAEAQPEVVPAAAPSIGVQAVATPQGGADVPPAPPASAPPSAADSPATDPSTQSTPSTTGTAAEPPTVDTTPPPTTAPAAPLITELARNVLERGTDARAWQSVVAMSVVGSDVADARFGHLEGTEGPAPDTATRFQLGGVTAAYTGLLLADLAVSGKVRLADPISTFLPAGATCADERVCAVTLAELAGGQSGLPALPPNLFPRDSRDVLRDYGEADLLQFLATYKPGRWPAASGDSLLADGLLG